MTKDVIKEIKIDNDGKLCIYPSKEIFLYIYRAAAQVNWDNENKFLYSPQPKEWSYFEWYKHIILIAKNEYGCELNLNKDTIWTNIPTKLKSKIYK